jgi:hypothetical protein
MVQFDPIEEDDSAELDVEAWFKARLTAIRRMPRCQRAIALRAAREWRQLALKALREKRARDRHGRYEAWQLRLPPPGPSA